MLPSFKSIYKINSETTLKQNLISVWEFEETTGTIAYDSHGSNDLTISGGVTLNQTGKTGKCFGFNGSTGELSRTSATAFQNLGDFSIAAWTYSVYSTGTDQYRVVLSKTLSTWTSPYYQLFLRVRMGSFQSWEAGFGTSSNFGLIVQNGAYNPNYWTHVVATRKAFTGDMNIYINGTHMGSPTKTQLPLTGNTGNDNTPIYIGDDSDLLSNFYNWSGYLDQIAVWGKELTASEVSTLYNSGNGLHYNNWQ